MVLKLFDDDTSLFSLVHDNNTSARDLNEDIEKISNPTFQWKINFTPDHDKQVQEIISSRKKTVSLHPVTQIQIQKYTNILGRCLIQI